MGQVLELGGGVMRRLFRPALLVSFLAVTMIIVVGFGVGRTFSLNQQTLTEVRELASENKVEIQEHRSRDLQSLCSTELHHHATLEAIIAVARQAGIDVSGFHIEVDSDISQACEESDLTPPFEKELERIHEQAEEASRESTRVTEEDDE